LLILPLVVFATWTLVVGDPLGGEPIAFASADLLPQNIVKKPDDAPVNVQVSGSTDITAPQPASPPGTRLVTIIDGTSGRRQSVLVPEFDGKGAAADNRAVDGPRQAPKAIDNNRAARPMPAKPN